MAEELFKLVSKPINQAHMQFLSSELDEKYEICRYVMGVNTYYYRVCLQCVAVPSYLILSFSFGDKVIKKVFAASCS
jgi:hypothetical protein